MTWRKYWRLLADSALDLRANRLRNLLAAIGLFIAVVGIIGIVTVSSIAQQVLVASEEQLDGRAPTMKASLSPPLLTAGWLTMLDSSMAHRIVTQGGSFAAAINVLGSVSAAGPSHAATGPGTNMDLELVTGNLPQVRLLTMEMGHWLATDGQVFPFGIVENIAASTQLGLVGSEASIGLGTMYQPLIATVIGVVADGDPSPVIYESLLAALSYQPAVLTGQNTVGLLVHNRKSSVSALASQLSSVGSDMGAGPSVFPVTRSDMVPTILYHLRTTRNGFFGAAAVVVLASVLGLLNIGLASVRERSKELSLRRALGMSRQRMFLLVLGSSLIVGVAAAVAAIVVAIVGVSVWVPHELNPASGLAAPTFPVIGALVGVSTGLGAALLGGCIPAFIACRVDVAAALRD